MHTLIFDIGKTNKKVFIFDYKFNVLYQDSVQFSEVKDEDGFNCDNISILQSWVIKKVDELVTDKSYQISKINFSCYGASLIHLGSADNVLTPLYNYLKPVSSEIFDELYQDNGGKELFTQKTASPALDMLNSGLQLYWLSKKRQEIFAQIKSTMHFPNYMGYLLHGKKISEYTSIGCHTALWNYEKSNYHNWLKKGNYLSKLPPLAKGSQMYSYLPNPEIKVGTGLHDSSAALVPYLLGSHEPFALLSTGTWSIFINPFTRKTLTKIQLELDCLSFLTIEGNPVMASRLFFGHYHYEMVGLLSKKYEQNNDFKTIKFDLNIYQMFSIKKQALFFKIVKEKDYISIETIKENQLPTDFHTAYHQLMYQLVLLQVQKIKLILHPETSLKTIYIDGGFTKNELFCKMLSLELPSFKWKTSDLAAGSSLGAAIAINSDQFDSSAFEKILNIKNV